MTDLSSGYSQVLKATAGTTTVYYTRGFELISRREGDASSFYLYDGGLSVRALTDETGAITDTLVFDAFGNETEKTGSTANTYKFQGEEQDATGLYYLRARYMDPVTGTFTSMDTYAGSLSDPMSLHKYLFANSNPVMYSDPSGLFSLADIDASMAIDFILNAGYMSGYLYIIDASITDPQLEHHDFTGYLCAIGFGMLFAALNLALSATVAGLLILAIIDTALGAAGTIKGVIDFINGHKIYGGLEILSSVLLTWFGWRNFASAVNAAKAVGNTSSTGIGSENNRSSNHNTAPNQNHVDNSNSSGSTSRGKGWKVGDPIDNLTKSGKEPSWSTVRARYWKNEAYYYPQNNSKSNLSLMKRGRAPKYSGTNISMELHHKNGRNIPNPHNPNNLEPLWPWDHAAKDTHRHYTGPIPEGVTI